MRHAGTQELETDRLFLRRLLPEAVFVPFPDCAHAEFVAGQPEAFAARLAETLERD